MYIGNHFVYKPNSINFDLISNYLLTTYLMLGYRVNKGFRLFHVISIFFLNKCYFLAQFKYQPSNIYLMKA